MAAPVFDGARMQCSYGLGEVTLRVDTRGVSQRGGCFSQATIDDYVPLVNIQPFRGCTAPANPQGANPAGIKPCTPRFCAPWSHEVDFIQMHGKRILEQRATLTCDYAGTVRLLDTAQEGITLNQNVLRNPDRLGKE
jgi:hypothetical protein